MSNLITLKVSSESLILHTLREGALDNSLYCYTHRLPVVVVVVVVVIVPVRDGDVVAEDAELDLCVGGAGDGDLLLIVGGRLFLQHMHVYCRVRQQNPDTK